MEKFKKKDLIKIKEDFFQNGFVVLKNFYSKKQLRILFKSISNIMSIAIKENNIKFSDKEKSKLEDKIDAMYLALKKQNPKLKANVYAHLKSLDKLSQLFSNDKIIKIINFILSSDSIIDHTQIRIDDMSNDRILDFHQELGQKSLMNITVWSPLKRLIKKSSGGIKVSPKSHKLRFLNHSVKGTNNNTYLNISSKTILEKKIKFKIIKINEGDLLMFHPLLIHGSVKNISKKIRWTAIARYNSFKYLRSFIDGKERFTQEKDQNLYKKNYNSKDFTWI